MTSQSFFKWMKYFLLCFHPRKRAQLTYKAVCKRTTEQNWTCNKSALHFTHTEPDSEPKGIHGWDHVARSYKVQAEEEEDYICPNGTVTAQMP